MSKGFTLIEFIIYIGIVAAVLVIAVNFSWEIIYGNIKSQVLREVQQNGRFAMEKITKTLRLGSNPDIFSVSNGILYQNNVPITTDQVKVTNLQITPVANTYKVNLSIEYNNPSGRNEYEADIDLESAVALLPTVPPVQGCWGIGSICDVSCQYSNYGSLVNYYIDPGCSSSCAVSGSFYINPSETCSSNGSGNCYKMENYSNQFASCSQGANCGGVCSGTCTLCRNLNQTQCSQQQGCYWFNGRCRGNCTSCSSFNDQISCQNQLGCSWQFTRWYWNLTNTQEGYSSYINCEWYIQN